jgi:hypothetical protein
MMKICDVLKQTVEDVTKFLDTAPRDELYTLLELSEKFGIAESTLRHSSTLKSYKTVFRARNYYGSPQALTAFMKQTRINTDEL